MTVPENMTQAAEALKVFPLPSAVLFPHSVVPLHIFEPRYRDMVRDALAGDRIIALAQLEPGWEPRYGGRPAMQPVLCAGIIIWHDELADGRYNILLQGVCRAAWCPSCPPSGCTVRRGSICCRTLPFTDRRRSSCARQSSSW